jgi:hypothetical protein
MAQGDVVFFDQFLVDALEGVHNLETNSVKIALVTNSTVPSATTSDPRYGAGGGTNFATTEVAAGGNYATGGATCANPAVTLTGGLAMFDADDPAAWAQHASNPTNATWGIVYNDTAAGKQCVCYVDLGGAFDMTTGALSIVWNANGLGRLDQA